jgi:formylglycine-generating enzyme required for sulfatase activity
MKTNVSGRRHAPSFVLLLLMLALPAGCSDENATDDAAKVAPARKAPTPDEDPPTPVFVKQEPPLILPMAPGVTMEFAWIPPGAFIMGDAQGDIPRRKIRFAKPFYLGRTEVTQQQWSAVMADNPSAMKGPKYPVHLVQWADSQALVKAMNARYGGTRFQFALPSEAQWEYACRAGKPRWESSDDPDQVERYAWLSSNSHYEPHPVAQKTPNAWGLYDMQGNVAEWCVHEVRPGSNADDPRRPAEAVTDSSDAPVYVVRGGNYREGASACTSTSRLLRRDVVPMRQDGLRLVCVPR